MTDAFIQENSLKGGKLLDLNFRYFKPWSMQEYTMDFWVFSMILFSTVISIYVLLVLPSYPLRVPQSLIKTVQLKSKQILDASFTKVVIPAYSKLYPIKVFITVEIENKKVPLNLSTLVVAWSGTGFTEDILSSALLTSPTLLANTKYSYFFASTLNENEFTLKNKANYEYIYSLKTRVASTQTTFDGEIRINFAYNYIKVR